MLFSSITFLYYFLPLTTALYFLAPKKFRNAVLLPASLVFYGWGEPKYLVVMILSILSGYIFGLFIEKYQKNILGRIFTIASVFISLSFLLYFKYANFFLENINAAAGLSLPLVQAALPIGISFYTFQVISYTLDVSRGEKAQKNLFSLALYIAMFPQLVAGPIVRYSHIAGQLNCAPSPKAKAGPLPFRTHSLHEAALGIRRFVLGLAKKILLANQLGELCSLFLASREPSVLFCWLYALAFTLEIYFDFSGYSDMAIGLGKIFGFHFPENFDYPYLSSSITEFWRRWHISLGTWFRDYVYIPLGGNRRGIKRQLLHILLVWLLTGLWHGASWNFVLWGLLFALLLTVEKLWLLKKLQKSHILSRIYTLFFVLLGFVLFNGETIPRAFSHIGGLFGAGGLPLFSPEALYCLRSFAVVLLLGILGATPLARNLSRHILKDTGSESFPLRWIRTLAEPAALAALMLLLTAYLADGSFNPFLYFRF